MGLPPMLLRCTMPRFCMLDTRGNWGAGSGLERRHLGDGDGGAAAGSMWLGEEERPVGEEREGNRALA